MQFFNTALVALCAASTAIATPTQKRQSEDCAALSSCFDQVFASLNATEVTDWDGMYGDQTRDLLQYLHKTFQKTLGNCEDLEQLIKDAESLSEPENTSVENDSTYDRFY